MFHFLAVVHIIASIIMIVFILLQDPKGGAMGMFGGGSSSLFGSTGANTFLLNVTKWTAVIFACTSIYLAALSSQRGTSVIDDYVPQTTPAVTPTEPENTPDTEPVQDEETPGESSSFNLFPNKSISIVPENLPNPLKTYSLSNRFRFLTTQQTLLIIN